MAARASGVNEMAASPKDTNGYCRKMFDKNVVSDLHTNGSNRCVRSTKLELS